MCRSSRGRRVRLIVFAILQRIRPGAGRLRNSRTTRSLRSRAPRPACFHLRSEHVRTLKRTLRAEDVK